MLLSTRRPTCPECSLVLMEMSPSYFLIRRTDAAAAVGCSKDYELPSPRVAGTGPERRLLTKMVKEWGSIRR